MILRKSSPYWILCFLLAGGTPLRAQSSDTLDGAWNQARPLVTIGSVAEDRLRLRQILGDTTTEGYLLRSPSSLVPRLGRDGGETRLQWEFIPPALDAVWNSDLPFSLNDGAMWAGRGWTTQIRAGVRAEFGPIFLVVAPQLVHVQNSGFRIIPSDEEGRSSFSPPWRTGLQSADLPLRFGNESYTVLDPGQSTLAVHLGPVAAGFSSENQWWGPGIRNAILMSNHAAGIPHLFLRTASPVETRFGSFEGRWMVGGLTESLFFDTLTSNDVRSISAIAATFQPALDRGLTLGVARAVYEPGGSAGGVAGRFLDALTRWGGDGDLTPTEREFEQVTTLFGRWVFPEDGFEAYTEWARLEVPGSFSELLVSPEHTQAYTLGAQWAKPLLGRSVFRLQTEVTYLEQTSPSRLNPVQSFYTSPAVTQGYTHRGQTVGAAIGPGSSSQWAAVDYFAPRWQVGVFAGRTRWDNDAYYTQPTGRSEVAHDVSLFGGIRAGGRLPWVDFNVELLRGNRHNYFFQNLLRGFGSDGAIDRSNTTLRLSVVPRLPSREAGRNGGI